MRKGGRGGEGNEEEGMRVRNCNKGMTEHVRRQEMLLKEREGRRKGGGRKGGKEEKREKMEQD